MARKKKKFIDKKNAITFSLVHRSQKDPLIADEDAPQHVLHPINGVEISENEKYGIFMDDGYDYMQHLKEKGGGDVELVQKPAYTKEKIAKEPKLKLPSSVFPSAYEQKVGMLNKAAPKGLQLDLDPDIVAAMDEDFNFDDPDNELEDDFIELANQSGGSDEEWESENSYSDEEDDEFDAEEARDRLFELEETKSRFTDYSMSSSVIRRNEHLSTLDDQFEEMFAQYEKNEIGALDCEEIEGDFDPKNDLLSKMVEKVKDQEEEYSLDNKPDVKFDVSKYKYIAYDNSSESDSDCSLIEVKKKEQWDCESILSTYSNLYNHPKVIDAPPSSRIKINSRTGIPVTDSKLTASNLAKFNGEPKSKATGPGSLVSMVSILSIRPKDESPDDRLSRKKAFRKYKKERRIERKLNTEAFKEEKKKMEKIMINNNRNKHQIAM